MFLATTALPEFWDREQELLFLGQWCRLYERRADWAGLRGEELPSPWNEPGALERGEAGIVALQEALLIHLAGFLNDAHGTRRDERYWRVLIGPWLLGYAAAIYDHGLHLDRAYATHPGLTTWTLATEDRRTPLDTADFAARLSTDVFQLQLYSEILESRGLRTTTRRASAPPAPRTIASRGIKPALRAILASTARMMLGSKQVFSDLYASPWQTLGLMRAASFAPLGESIAAPDARPAPGRRAALADLRCDAPYAAEAAALLARHLPTLFLEGFADFRSAVRARWPRLPSRLLTSVGWYSNETFKLLAAEASAEGAELVLGQHGGGYGMMDPALSEAHERRVADRYITWGWTDARYPGARLLPLPHPKMLFKPVRRRAASRGWLLISTTLYRYPYTCYLASAPAAHRYAEQLDDRARFLRGLSPAARSGLRVRLHHADLGWGHRARLTSEFPDLAFDASPEKWTSRAGDFALIAIDHPQTSILESYALDVPTIAFWNPGLWRMRPDSEAVLDGLRRAGLLLDSPADAAAAIPGILADPAAWWGRPEARAAREAFRDRHARSSPDWLAAWTQALDAA